MRRRLAAGSSASGDGLRADDGADDGTHVEEPCEERGDGDEAKDEAARGEGVSRATRHAVAARRSMPSAQPDLRLTTENARHATRAREVRRRLHARGACE